MAASRRFRSAAAWRRPAAALLLIGGAPAAALAQPAAPAAPPVAAAYLGDARLRPAITCGDLVKTSTPLVTVERSVDQAAGPFTLHGPGGDRTFLLPDHCLATGVIEKRTGVDGKPYGIHFELRLPRTWNGRFLFQGGGGINGVVNPALGSVKGPPALARGFAVVTQDAGHSGTDASFGADQQARIDMIYRSYDRVTSEAKRIVAAYYGRAAERSYFMGCSEGGREALLVSQRMPLAYDGVVAGDPGFLLGVSFDDVAGRMALARIAAKGSDGKPDLASAFRPAQIAALAHKVNAECDAKDGLVDGIIDNPQSCRPKIEELVCAKGAADAACLSAPQIAVLHDIFDGGLPAGHGVTARGYFYNGALDLPPWRDKLAGFGGLRTPPVSSIQGLFVSPYQPDYDDSAIDFAKDGARFDEVGGMNRADGVGYSSFVARGAKLLIYTGLADPGFSAKTLAAYYERLAAANGGPAAAASFTRLFLAPGMLHCRGGKALDDFDPLGAVVAWAERGTAPERLVATGATFPGRSRPICPYPLQSRYKGTGSIEDAANFDCRPAS